MWLEIMRGDEVTEEGMSRVHTVVWEHQPSWSRHRPKRSLPERARTVGEWGLPEREACSVGDGKHGTKMPWTCSGLGEGGGGDGGAGY